MAKLKCISTIIIRREALSNQWQHLRNVCLISGFHFL